jgi:ADP-ribosyl-[dinitrogen reductase] hydrolase
MELIDRYRGSLLGLAAGDALGTTVEFKPEGSFEPLTTIVGGGPFGLRPGEWTDDTSMALCLADSLVESNGFDPSDQMARYCLWRDEGYLSSNGRCFDIGITVGDALRSFKRNGDPFANKDPDAAGNGSLMRLAPVPLYFAHDPVNAIEMSVQSSLTTHGSKEASDACRYYSSLILGAITGKHKDKLLADSFEIVPGMWESTPLEPKIAQIAQGAFKDERPPRIDGGGGYVVPSLHVSLWAFFHTDNFRDGALTAVNVGRDADTYGAIYGQLAGAYYGENGIPLEWRSVIAKRELIECFAEKLLIKQETKEI